MQLEQANECTSCQSSETRQLAEHGPFGLRVCQRCALMFVSPRPSAEELAKIYQEDYFDGSGAHGNQDGYLSQSSGYQARSAVMVDWILQLSKVKGGKWLDIGCGPGYLLQAASQRGFQAEGVDVSAAAVEFGKKRLGLDLKVCVAEELASVATGPYAVVTMFDSLFHLRSPREVVEQAARLLQPGGVFFAGPFDLHPADWRPPTAINDTESLGIPEHLSFVNQTSMSYLLKTLEFNDIQFHAMPETPSELMAKRKIGLPRWLVALARRLIRLFPFLQRLVHKAAARTVNPKAGYVLARKA